MSEPDERLAPALPEVPADAAAEGIPSGWRVLAPGRTLLHRRREAAGTLSAGR